MRVPIRVQRVLLFLWVSGCVVLSTILVLTDGVLIISTTTLQGLIQICLQLNVAQHALLNVCNIECGCYKLYLDRGKYVYSGYLLEILLLITC